MSDQPGGGAPPPPGQPPQAPPPQAPPPQAPPPQAPPPQNWQSTPQPPGPPPAGGGQPGGMPSWTANITAQNTIAGPGGVALADAPARIIAIVIDFIILGIIGFVVNTIMTGILGDNYLGIFGLAYRTPSLISSIATVLVLLAVTGAYFVLMWTRMGGATVGMKVMKLTVRDQATGGTITQSQAITRWLFLGAPWAVNFLYGWSIGFIVSILILVYYIYLLVSIAQDPMRQGLHDKQAKTVVAKGA